MLTEQKGPLGVGRYDVILAPYTKEWADLYSKEKLLLQSALGGAALRIEHIGSTSVPGLLAKPILDILVGGSSMSMLADAMPRLEKLGYVRKPKASSPTHIFMAKGPEEARTHYLHMVRLDSLEWRRYTRFRDFLLRHPETRDEYAHLKAEWAQRYPHNRALYTHSKEEFVKKVLELAAADAPQE